MKSELPHGSQVKGIHPCGGSYWTRTAEIVTVQADGSPLSFFLKVCCFLREPLSNLLTPYGHLQVTHKEVGKARVSGEFTSMSYLHKALPKLTPVPYACRYFSELLQPVVETLRFFPLPETVVNVSKITQGERMLPIQTSISSSVASWT